MYQYEMSQLRTAELRRQADAWRLVRAAEAARRDESPEEGRVVKRKGGVRQALRAAVRQHGAGAA